MFSKSLGKKLFLLDSSCFLPQSFLARFPFGHHGLAWNRVEQWTRSTGGLGGFLTKLELNEGRTAEEVANSPAR